MLKDSIDLGKFSIGEDEEVGEVGEKFVSPLSPTLRVRGSVP
ncbi:hypothetical protein [Nostoc sp. NIES-3756]|nr:hypothetical protein [Nostoc sp. NIES-3756]